MFVFAIETCGLVAALTKEQDPITLDGFLSGDRDEGKHLRTVLLKSSQVWDGVSPFTARLATKSEALDYDDVHANAEGAEAGEIESRWYYMAEYYGPDSPYDLRDPFSNSTTGYSEPFDEPQHAIHRQQAA